MGIGEFFKWWRTELAGMLPAQLRRGLPRRRDNLLLSLSNGEVRVDLRRNGRSETLDRIRGQSPDDLQRMTRIIGRFEPATCRVDVSVPTEHVLTKEIHLPLAAEENLREVLGFEMPRQTPFRTEQVYYKYRTIARNQEDQQLAVRLCAVPRTTIDPILAPFSRWNLVLADGGAQAEGKEDLFTFLSEDATQSRAGGLQSVLVAVNLLLLATVIVLPLMQQQRYFDELRGRLEEARAAASTASDLQQRIDEQRARVQYLFQQKAVQPASVELLEELSRRIPDDTWLVRLEIREGKVQLQGTSTTASALISALEGSHFFEDVRFASPVTRDGANERERFHLSARILAPTTPLRENDTKGSGT